MKQARSSETKDRVIEAATELVIELGHEQVALKDIVTRSGVSNGSIFHHFGSKDGILEHIFVCQRREYLSHVRDAILAFEGDPCDAIGAGAGAALAFLARDPDRHFRLSSQFSHSDWLSRNKHIWHDLALEIAQPVNQWALPHLAEGRLPMLPPQLIQSMMVGPPEMVFHQWRGGQIPGDLLDHVPRIELYVAGGLKALRNAPQTQPS